MLGEIIGGVSSLLGGFLSSQAAQDNMQANIDWQRRFAKNAIQWKVQDATKAGVHPLYALGANTTAFSPVTAGGDTSMGSAISRAGQDIGRAVAAGQNESSRTQNVLAGLQVERAGLENELIRSQINRLRQSQNPSVPAVNQQYAIPGQGPTALPPIPEDTKQKNRPLLQLGGEKITTDPGTSNMNELENRYGDEGPVAATLPLIVAWNDMQKHYGPTADWPSQMMSSAWDMIKRDAIREYMNARNYTLPPRWHRPLRNFFD